LGTKFHSAQAQGVVSAVLCSQKILSIDNPTAYLLDVNILPGMEGGAVLDQEQRLVGMVAEPIIASEVGAIFHLAWPMQHLLDLFCTVKRINRTRMSEAEYQVDRVSWNLSSVVVGVEDGYSWASGLFLPADGLILTNAHAIHGKSQGNSNEMRIYMPLQQRYFSGMLLHSFSKVLDLAVLKITGTYSSEVNIENPIFAKRTIRQGVSILSAGFPLWRPSSPYQMHSALSEVKVTGGQITSVLYDDEHHVAAFTTNSKVINGSSGGPVFEHGTGDIIGLITSNTKLLQLNYSEEKNTLSSEKTIFPCLNYCIPSNILLAAVEAVKDGETDTFEHRLERAGITQMWQSMDKYEMKNVQNSKL
jgi:S1-C subfamily serine protease